MHFTLLQNLNSRHDFSANTKSSEFDPVTYKQLLYSIFQKTFLLTLIPQTYISLDDDQITCDLLVVESLFEDNRAREGERDIKCLVRGL